MNKKMIKSSIVITLAAVLISAAVLAAGPGVRAASGSIVDIAEIPKPGDKMDAEYEFIAKFINGTTTVETFGSGWRETTFSATNSEPYYSIVPSANQKGSIGVRYKNVGVYNGVALDLKITIHDWETYYREQANISYRRAAIGHIAQGYNYVDQSWEFVQSGTDKAVAVNGYMTINDVDNSQGVKFDKATSAAIADIYVAGADNWIRYDDSGGEYHFYEANDESSNSNDLHAMFTFTYKNRASLNFKWMTDFAGRGSSPGRVVDTNYASGEFFGFIAKKPLATATAVPHKVVSDEDEQQVTSNTLGSRAERFEYLITHNVPDEWKDFYYKSYTFTDQLPECLEVCDVRITNLEGADVSSWFDVQVKGSTVTAAAKATQLAKSSFYYDTYSFLIVVQVREDADLSGYMNGAAAILKNTAAVDIDGDKASSNEVQTRIPVQENKIVKSIVLP